MFFSELDSATCYYLYMRRQHEFSETEEVIELKVSTYCPEKWVLVDTETGQVYKGNAGGYWDRLDPVIRKDR